MKSSGTYFQVTCNFFLILKKKIMKIKHSGQSPSFFAIHFTGNSDKSQRDEEL